MGDTEREVVHKATAKTPQNTVASGKWGVGMGGRPLGGETRSVTTPPPDTLPLVIMFGIAELFDTAPYPAWRGALNEPRLRSKRPKAESKKSVRELWHTNGDRITGRANR